MPSFLSNIKNRSEELTEIPVSSLVKIGACVKQAQQLLQEDVHWEPQRQLAKLWQKRLARLEADVEKLSAIDEPILIVAVTGGVKAGKTHLANMILGQQILAESLRHETRRAWTVIHQTTPQDDVIELLQPVSPDWLRFVPAHSQIANRKLILIDLPDFDSESQVAGFQENRQIVEQIIPAVDVVVFVSSQAHNLTKKSFDWLKQFQEAHGFIFVYNEVSGPEESDGKQRIEQLQEQVNKAGFANKTHVVNCRYAPGDYTDDTLRRLLTDLPANRTLRSWRLVEMVHQMIADIKEVYESQSIEIQKTVDTIRTQVALPLHHQFESEIKSQLEGLHGTFQREMLFRSSQKIGGILGGFISLRRFLSYWSLPGVWLGSRLMGPTGALVATGSLVFGSLIRRFEAWRDRRQLKVRPLAPEIAKQNMQLSEQANSINLELQHVQLDPVSEIDIKSSDDHQKTVSEKIADLIELAFENELTGEVDESSEKVFRRFLSWCNRVAWNLIPSAFIIYAFVAIIFSFLKGLPVLPPEWHWIGAPNGFSFYINALTILLGICYIEYLLLMLLHKKAARRVAERVFGELVQMEHPFILEIKKRLSEPMRFYSQALNLENELETVRKVIRRMVKGLEISDNL